jgi:CheY-like chemotaxis protein
MTSASPEQRIRILLVEDDEDDAALVSRMLLMLAPGSKPELRRAKRLTQALELLDAEPFDAVLLDLGLPDASGLQALDAFVQREPRAAIIPLTGSYQQELGLEAVQRGAQDYLVKGHITAALLERSIRYGMERTRILNQQREFLERTLRGSVDALVSVLALADPTSFGRAMRLKRYARDVADGLGIREHWPIEVAAMVSQLGWIQVSPETCQRVYRGEALSADEQDLVNRTPGVALDLLDGIPHLDPVRAILAHLLALRTQRARPEPSDVSAEAARAASILELCLEFDLHESGCGSTKTALLELRDVWTERDHELFRALARSRFESPADREPLPIQAVRPGMILGEDVLTKDGRLLVARGQQVSKTLLSRLRAYAQAGELTGPIQAYSPPEPARV